MFVSPESAQLQGKGHMGLNLPGWDRYSVWGWDDREACLFAQLWRNDDDSELQPRVWMTPAEGWPATGMPEVLAEWIAQATGSTISTVLEAMAQSAPGSVGESLRAKAAAAA